jgi:DNA-binding MurR/RpiR family transcriptional regulator
MTSGVAVLREILDSCTDAERKAADRILAEPRAAVFCTISELARQAGTSAPAVVRLCKRAGLSGYRELQLLLTRDLYAPEEQSEIEAAFEFDSDRSAEEIASNLLDRTKEALDRVLSIMPIQTYEEAAAAIGKARSVATFGSGASGIVAYDLALKLLRVGIPCSHSFDPGVQITAACGLGPADIAVAISYSGSTEANLRAAQEAKKSGARLIAITRLGTNPLSRIADLILPVPASEPIVRLGTSVSRSSQLLVVDILYGILVSRSTERSLPLIERSARAARGIVRNEP